MGGERQMCFGSRLLSFPWLGSTPMTVPLGPAGPRASADRMVERLLREGMAWGDRAQWLPALPAESVDLWFTSPPYADARAYSRIHPDRYVDWFLPYSESMLSATRDT